MGALRTAFQILLTACLVLLAAAAAVVIHKLTRWPYPTLGLALLTVVVAVLGLRFGPGLVRRILAARAAAPPPADAAAARRVEALGARWKLLVKQLRASRLGARAAEALPWFLLLGEDGAGKTSSLRNSQRAVTLSAAGAEPGLEWAFLDGAVVLEAPGAWLRPADEADRAEWREVLSLLRRTRSGTPLDGVVLAVAADALLRKGAEELKADAAALRERLDEALRRLGVRFPAYVLVTRWDKVEGMGRFCQALPPEAWSRAVGAAVEPGVGAVAAAGDVVDRLAARLADLRLTVLAEPRSEELRRPALLFPAETSSLRQPLSDFLGVLFAEDPYRESAVLRGLFFASAHQEGRAAPGLLGRLGFADEEVPAATEDRSYFLSGFWGEVLPADRGLSAPTSRALLLRALTRNLGLTAWVAAWLALSAALTVSFSRQLGLLREAGLNVPSRADLTGRPGPELAAVDRLRAAAERVEGGSDGWGLGALLLPQGRRAAEGLWAEHDRRFRGAVLGPLDGAFGARLEKLHGEGSPEELAAAADLLVKRANLLDAAAQGRPAAEVAGLPQPSYAWLLGAPDRETLLLFQRNYLAHLTRGRSALAPELSAQRERLNRLLAREGAALDWVVEWANLQPALAPVGLSDFWGTGGPPDAPSVPGAYTPGGWREIERFLGQIGSAFPEGGRFAETRSRFEAAYRRDYLRHWERFVETFSGGEAAWTGRERRVELALRLGGRESPYARLLAALPAALEPAVHLAPSRGELPGWVPLAYRFDRLREPSYQEVLRRGQGALGTAAARGAAALGRLWDKLEGGAREDASLAEDIRALPSWLAYQDALVKSAERARSAQAAYQLARDAFAEADLAVGEPQQPILRLYWAAEGLRKALGRGAAGEEVLWQLLDRQADQVWSAVVGQAELAVEKAWEGDVLGAAAGLTGVERVDALLGPNGKVWEFQDKVLGPFVTKTFRRPQPRVLHGASLRLSGAFLDLAGRGKVGQQAIRGSARVQVSALPTDANPEASVKPHLTRLVLQCNAGSQELVNQNYPVSRTFTWTPEDCADVTLEIGVGNLVLKRWYPGVDGFAKFLGEFRGGRRVFRPADFPEQRRALAAYRVEAVTVNYAFRGQEAVESSAASAPVSLPDRIVP